MTTKQTIPATQNEAWGFFGTMNDNAEAAWPIAMTAISDATCQPLESVRLFLDSRHGRHFADDVLNEMLRGQTIQQAIDAGIDHAVDAALKGGNVELVIFGIGNNDGRDNAGEYLSCHKNLLSCLAGGPMPPTLVGSVQAV